MDQITNLQTDNRVISIRSADRLPRSIVFDRGFKIIGTPLAFRGSRNPGLLFFSDLNMKVPAGTKRLIGTNTVVGSLGSRMQRMDAIAVSYDRSFKLGKMDLRLLPSGMGPGASLLEITYNNRRIIYSSGLRTTTPLMGESIPEIKCEILLIDFEMPETKPPAPRTIKPRLIEWYNTNVSKVSNISPVVLCDSAPALFDAFAVFSEIPDALFAHSSSYNILRHTSMQTNHSHRIKRLSREWPKSGVVFGTSQWFYRSAHHKNEAILRCYCGPDVRIPIDTSAFRLGEPEHVGGLVQFAKKCGARTVALSPSAGDVCAAAFRKAGFDVYFSRIPKQLKLPL
ncbi:MAG: hypothetical protein JXR76_31055 [Deltaproteobacteria bacterium]|nr:hypothetical protein [Deltaproteobacteria bacterium]